MNTFSDEDEDNEPSNRSDLTAVMPAENPLVLGMHRRQFPLSDSLVEAVVAAQHRATQPTEDMEQSGGSSRDENPTEADSTTHQDLNHTRPPLSGLFRHPSRQSASFARRHRSVRSSSIGSHVQDGGEAGYTTDDAHIAIPPADSVVEEDLLMDSVFSFQSADGTLALENEVDNAILASTPRGNRGPLVSSATPSARVPGFTRTPLPAMSTPVIADILIPGAVIADDGNDSEMDQRVLDDPSLYGMSSTDDSDAGSDASSQSNTVVPRLASQRMRRRRPRNSGGGLRVRACDFPPRTGAPPTLLSLPTEVLRYATDNYLPIRVHATLRLVSRHFDAFVRSNCRLWARRIVHYSSHGFTSACECEVWLQTVTEQALFSVNAAAEQERLSRRQHQQQSDNISDPGFELDVASNETNVKAKRMAYCFRGCAYRTWQALKLQRVLSSVQRFHKQKQKYYGGASALDVLFHPSAGAGTAVATTILILLLTAFLILWSTFVSIEHQHPVNLPVSFLPLWIACVPMILVLFAFGYSAASHQPVVSHRPSTLLALGIMNHQAGVAQILGMGPGEADRAAHDRLAASSASALTNNSEMVSPATRRFLRVVLQVSGLATTTLLIYLFGGIGLGKATPPPVTFFVAPIFSSADVTNVSFSGFSVSPHPSGGGLFSPALLSDHGAKIVERIAKTAYFDVVDSPAEAQTLLTHGSPIATSSSSPNSLPIRVGPPPLYLAFFLPVTLIFFFLAVRATDRAWRGLQAIWTAHTLMERIDRDCGDVLNARRLARISFEKVLNGEQQQPGSPLGNNTDADDPVGLEPSLSNSNIVHAGHFLDEWLATDHIDIEAVQAAARSHASEVATVVANSVPAIIPLKDRLQRYDTLPLTAFVCLPPAGWTLLTVAVIILGCEWGGLMPYVRRNFAVFAHVFANTTLPHLHNFTSAFPSAETFSKNVSTGVTLSHWNVQQELSLNGSKPYFQYLLTNVSFIVGNRLMNSSDITPSAFGLWLSQSSVNEMSSMTNQYPPGALVCPFDVGVFLSPLCVVMACCAFTIRQLVGFASSWRKVGRRLPPFQALIILSIVIAFGLSVLMIGFCASSTQKDAWIAAHDPRVIRERYQRENAMNLPYHVSVHDFIPLNVPVGEEKLYCAPWMSFLLQEEQQTGNGFLSSTASSLSFREYTPSTSCGDRKFLVPVLSVSLVCPQLHRVDTSPWILVLPFLVICAALVNLGHDRGRYYSLKMVKYCVFFERLSAASGVSVDPADEPFDHGMTDLQPMPQFGMLTPGNVQRVLSAAVADRQ